VFAAVAIDGRFAWDEHDIQRMEKVFRYTVLGGMIVAHHARCIDIEAGNSANSPERYMPFLVERTRHYGDATAYVNRSNHAQVAAECEKAGILSAVHFWIATLDGTQDVPGAWAVQYQGGLHAPFDVSVLHGVNNFHRP
jgi:hypothetical protein